MKASVTAAEKSAKAAEKSADVAEQSLVSIERALVFAKTYKFFRPEELVNTDVPWRFSAMWMNTGRSWPKRCFNHTNWQAFDTPMPDEFEFPDLGDVRTRAQFFIGLGAEMWGQDLEIPHAIVVDVIERRKYLYFWGWCEYNDIFINTPRHRTEFCVMLQPVNVIDETNAKRKKANIQFTTHKKHNGADDDCLKPLQT